MDSVALDDRSGHIINVSGQIHLVNIPYICSYKCGNKLTLAVHYLKNCCVLYYGDLGENFRNQWGFSYPVYVTASKVTSHCLACYVILKADPVISRRNIEMVFGSSNMPQAKGF